MLRKFSVDIALHAKECMPTAHAIDCDRSSIPNNFATSAHANHNNVVAAAPANHNNVVASAHAHQ